MLIIAILLSVSVLNAYAVPVATEEKEPGAEYLLPNNEILPQLYDVTIDVSNSFENIKNREFVGKVTITAVVNKNNIDSITLHATNITLTQQLIVQSDKNNDVNIYKTHDFQEDKQFLVIKLNKKLEFGVEIKIIIEYTGVLQDDMHGFYVSKYDKEYVLTTQFQPTHARKAFPCFDEPKYKAIFKLTVIKPKEYNVLSNTKSEALSNDEKVIFEETPKMSTYLVAFIVHKFQNKSAPDDDTFNVWSRPSASEQTASAAENVKEIVENLNNFTGIEYQKIMKKMDMAALPDFSAGAMENWGLLTYRETALLVNEELSTNRDIQRVISVIAHEVAHQWFGNLVTLSWWNNTWLNEGFARYFEYHTTGNVKPSWEMKDQFVVEQQQSVFGIDALAKTTPLTLSVYNPTQISSHFGTISYGKGGSVIRMMEHFLGSDIFQKGLQKYLHENQLKNTEPLNLWTAFEEVLEINNVSLDYTIEKIMSTWISQPGYPVINVDEDVLGNVVFSQQRFYINTEENTKSEELLWYVPISYTTSNEKDFNDLKPKLWLTLNEPTKMIHLNKTDFIVVNIQESGYYRVNYNEHLWLKIASALKKNKDDIHHLNRAQIVDDVLNLARAGLTSYSTAFTVVDYLSTETNYYPWYSAFQGFRYLLQRYSETDDTGKELRLYMNTLMENLIKIENFEETNEKQVDVFKKVDVLEWACNLGHAKCIEQATELFKKYKEENSGSTKNESIIPRNLRSTVFCTAVRHGNKNDWTFLWNKYVNSNLAAEKIGILNALGCSKDVDTLNEYLNKSINDDRIRKQDAYYVFSSVLVGNSIGVTIAFEFLQNNHEKIIEKYNGMNDLEKAILGLGSRLTDEKQITKFENYLNSSDDFETFREAAKETVKQNLAWANKYKDDIGNLLKQKRNSASSITVNKYYLYLSLGILSIYYSMRN